MASKEILYKIGLDGVPQVVSGADAAGRAMGRLGTGSANAGVALQNLNFVIRDSPYFFRDFSLGILAVGNNLNPLIDSMQRLKAEAAGVNQTLGQALVAALKGPAGVVLAFSALVTILQAVVFAFSGTKKEARETKDEIDELTKSVEKYSKETARSMVAQLESQIGKRKGEILKESSADTEFAIGITRKFYPSMSESELRAAAQEQAYAQDEELRKLYEKKAIYDKYLNQENYVLNLKNEIAELEDLALHSSKEVALNLKQIIADKQKELELATKVTKKKKEEVELTKDQMEMIRYLSQLNDAYEEQAGSQYVYGEKYASRLNNMDSGRGMQFGTPDQLSSLLGRGTDTRSFNKFLAESKRNLSEAAQMAHLLGRELTSAFKNGKFELDKFIESLLSAIAEMAIMNLLTAIFTGGSSIPFGIAAKAGGGGGGFLPIDKFDRPMSGGNTTFVFENVIDGQKIIYKGIKEKQAILR